MLCAVNAMLYSVVRGDHTGAAAGDPVPRPGRALGQPHPGADTGVAGVFIILESYVRSFNFRLFLAT